MKKKDHLKKSQCSESMTRWVKVGNFVSFQFLKFCGREKKAVVQKVPGSKLRTVEFMVKKKLILFQSFIAGILFHFFRYNLR